jgi:hypothetical protein
MLPLKKRQMMDMDSRIDIRLLSIISSMPGLSHINSIQEKKLRIGKWIVVVMVVVESPHQATACSGAVETHG